MEVAEVPGTEGVARETSWWPFLLATSLTLFCSVLPFSRWLALPAFALVLACAIGWAWSDALRPPPAEGTVGGHGRLWWGMVLLIVSEAGLFLAGFPAISAHPDALQLDINRPLTFVASLVLWGSGFVGAWALRRRERGRGFAWGLGATLLMGLAFVGYQAFEYARLLGEGFSWRSGGAGSIFYFLTGMHGAHVVAGLALLMGTALVKRREPLRAAMLYWHFVDAMWVLIYGVLYVKLL